MFRFRRLNYGLSKGRPCYSTWFKYSCALVISRARAFVVARVCTLWWFHMEPFTFLGPCYNTTFLESSSVVPKIAIRG